MNKQQFMQSLELELRARNIEDIEDILIEYENHYEFRLQDGYSEQDISIRLGDPKAIAEEYGTSVPTTHRPKKLPVLIGLYTLDFIVLMLIILFALWVVVLLSFSLSSLMISISLFTGVNFQNWIPTMPYWCGAVLGISFLSLAFLSSTGVYYSYRYLGQFIKAYRRTHANTVKYVTSKPSLPSLPYHPILTKIQFRKLRTTFLISLNAFAISFVLGYIVCALTAESLEFWHVFGWFQ